MTDVTAVPNTCRVHRFGADATVTEVWLRRDVVELRVDGRLERRDAFAVADLLTALVLEGASDVRVLAPSPVDRAVRAVLDRALRRPR